jgi:protein-S-isoprenylcysteine O-methyltransferase Ste14
VRLAVVQRRYAAKDRREISRWRRSESRGSRHSVAQSASWGRLIPRGPAPDYLAGSGDWSMNREDTKPAHPPVYFLAALSLMGALHFFLPVWKWQQGGGRRAGGILAGFGIAVILWAAYCFRKARTTVKPFKKPRRLVACGPYRFSRNPMYFGLALLLAGAVAFLSSATPVLALGAFVWLIDRRCIRPEEELLAEAFGADYQRYKNRVRRWL